MTDDTIPQDIREKARISALTAVGMVCRNVADQEDWSVEVDYVTEIIARASHAERLTTEARVREESVGLPPTDAVRDVLAERRRQVEDEGWTAERDDAEHADGQLAAAAGCYAGVAGTGKGYEYHVDRAKRGRIFGDWPWNRFWWKPTTPRRDLVKAGALILAEIERIDRAAIREGR